MVALECARPWSLAGRSARYCATFLRSPEATERARAARLAGELHELELVPDVIALLEDGELAVRRSAEGALARMAGVPLGAEAAAWEAWHERELDWRDTRWSELLATLVGARAGPANEALRELARHPLFRHEVARALAESLPEQPSTVALASCVELENIGSRWAVPGLVSALERGPAQLKAAAWRTLRALSGEARELSLAVWRAWVDS
jgi:HEAT repeat protein